MAKSDLLKEAIADAKAVKETALENAKIALQEAFAPKFESMFANKIAEELEDEEGLGDEFGDEMPADELGDEMPAGDEFGEEEGEGVEWIDNDISFKVGGASYDAEIGNPTADVGEEPVGDEFGEEPVGDEFAEEPVDDEVEEEDDLNLEAIIRELEGADEIPSEGDEILGGLEDEYSDETSRSVHGESIDDIIEAILREEDEHDYEEDEDEEEHEDEDDEDKEEANEGKYGKMKEELEEAYATVAELKSIINEVNLLNAKLLYTNKLFRNFELNEAQKMKVIENFDRAVSTREAKLVFTTLAESFTKKPKAKKMVKESYASKPAASTAPRKETTQVLSEGFELANRWKKLAGLI